MKHMLLLLFTASSSVLAQSFVVEGTNVIQIRFQDATLSDSHRAWIGSDILRTVTPGLAFTSLEPYTNRTNGYLSGFFVPEVTEITPPLTSEVSIFGTNIIMTIDKDYTDHYRAQEQFFNTHSNAIAKAFEFADLLITNPIMGMITNQIRGLRLTRAYVDSQIPLKFVEDIRNDLGDGVYFRPSLLGFQMLPYGPSGAAEYLWGYLPNRYSRGVNSVPMIYYNDRWWISYWHLEEDEEEW